MKSILIFLVLYVSLGIIWTSAGMDIGTWQYWASLVLVGAIDVISYVQGLYKNYE